MTLADLTQANSLSRPLSSPEAVTTPGGQQTPELSAGPFCDGDLQQIDDPGHVYPERISSATARKDWIKLQSRFRRAPFIQF